MRKPKWNLNDMGIELAQYIINNDKERNDYMKSCEENGWYYPVITMKCLSHIYAIAVVYMYESGYDVDFKVYPKE